MFPCVRMPKNRRCQPVGLMATMISHRTGKGVVYVNGKNTNPGDKLEFKASWGDSVKNRGWRGVGVGGWGGAPYDRALLVYNIAVDAII